MKNVKIDMTMSSVKNIDILLVENLKTGKTSIINRYVDNKYDSNVERTICFDMRLKHVIFKNKKRKKMFYQTMTGCIV